MVDSDPQQLGRIEQAIIDIKEDVAETKKDVKQGFFLMNGRVRKLEYWRAYVIGIAVVIAFLLNRFV